MEQTEGVFVRVYEDFSPSSIGVNVRSLVLSYASKHTPVVLLINEVEEHFERAAQGQQTFDPRLQHARDRTELNNMLDAISQTPYVIALYTTERFPEQLWSPNTEHHQAHRSFTRPGRVDTFVHMTEQGCTIRSHVQVREAMESKLVEHTSEQPGETQDHANFRMLGGLQQPDPSQLQTATSAVSRKASKTGRKKKNE